MEKDRRLNEELPMVHVGWLEQGECQINAGIKISKEIASIFD
jgi:hypothetical protein